MPRKAMLLAAILACPALMAHAQEVTFPTSGSWQELAFGSGTIQSEISASGPGWSLSAEKIQSAVTGPDGWEWQTTYVNGVLALPEGSEGCECKWNAMKCTIVLYPGKP